MINNTPTKKEYQTRKDNVQRMLSQLSELVADHSRSFRDDSSNWAYVGDLGHVEEHLREALNFLQVNDKE